MSDHESPKLEPVPVPVPVPVVFLPSDAFAVERVFPIRSLVRDTEDPRIGPQQDASTEADAETANATADVGATVKPTPTSESTFLPAPYPDIPPKETIRRLSDTGSDVVSDGEGGRRRRTERSKMVPASSGPPGVVVPGILFQPTSQERFYRCEDEPIHTPGAIQQYGALLALRYSELSELQVRIASENAQKLLGYGLEQLFHLRSFVDILDQESREDMIARVNHALNKVNVTKTEDTHLDVFAVSIYQPDGSLRHLWCAIHISNGTKDLIICEFEEHSEIFRLEEQFAKALPKQPVQTIDMDVHPKELKKSTTRTSLPLRVLEIARLKQQTGVASMDIFNAMTQAQEQLAGARSVQEVLDTVVGIVSELTGFHRVMFYRFDGQKNGCVDAELVDPHASADLFRGLHFPASDIPKQARALYKINRIRILHDRDAETARLVCRDESDFQKPLDLTHAYLRAMSPIHLKYLANMHVRSSMSVSVVINGDLWGLVACHGYGDIGIRVTLPIRELCRNIGDCAATNIERLLMLQRILARKTPTIAPPTQAPASFIAASSADLLRAFDADFGLLSIHDEARAIGRLDPYREALVVLSHLQKRRFVAIFISQNINEDFPDISLKYAPGIRTIAGLLLIPLSIGGSDFLVFFRKGQLKEISWAGNPYEKLRRPGSDYLEPRTSFKRWTETVEGMSREWTEDQMETASVLGLLYGKFIEIWRQKEAVGNNNRMTRLLLRNSSHEVRTPLNAIVNYLDIALENQLDDSTREILSKAHRASRSLIYVIDDLLNLTKAEDGPVSSVNETFDLGTTVSEAITAFRKEAMRKNLDLTVSTHQGIPEIVKGDGARLRQVISNVTSNAFQHSTEGGIKVDIRPLHKWQRSSLISITVQDVGIGMSESQLDDLFQEFEQVVDEETAPASETTTPSNTPKSAKPLGVGLAVVARYVRNMKGHIRMLSEPGKGTIFCLELPFEHADPPAPPAALSSSQTFSSSQSIPDTSSSAKVARDREDELSPLPGSHDPPSPDSQPSLTASTPGQTPGDGSSSSHGDGYPFPRTGSQANLVHRQKLCVLIAEDNPINARLLSRRLSKLGYEVEATQDGQECHDIFVSKPNKIDAILMDIQMPLVDGVLSTRMVRAYESEVGALSGNHQRVPIIAVSASLREDSRFDYVQSGFDAWILKPIDFGRLDYLLRGIHSSDLKKDALYIPGHWEKGGWFMN